MTAYSIKLGAPIKYVCIKEGRWVMKNLIELIGTAVLVLCFNEFFERLSLKIALERLDVAENKYDRAKAFKKEKEFNDNAIVMGGELVRLVCVAGARYDRIFH